VKLGGMPAAFACGDGWVDDDWARCEFFSVCEHRVEDAGPEIFGGKTYLEIGSDNVFREHVTVHTATGDGLYTRIGSHNNFLAYSHVAHDCIVGTM